MLAGLVVAAALVIAALALTVFVLSSHKIHGNIYIDEIAVGGMTKEQASAQITGLADANRMITVGCGEVKKQFTLGDIGACYSVEASVDEAYAIGRTGNIFRRIYDFLYVKAHSAHVPVSVTCDEGVLSAYIEEIAGQVDQPQREREISLEGNVLTVKRGHSGQCINREHAREAVLEAIGTRGADEVSLTLETVDPKPIEVDSIYDEVCGDPVDANYRVENYKLTIVPEKVGIQFDKAEAKRIIRETEGDVISIPVETIAPQKTAKDVENSLFPDQLATYSTKYAQSNTNRSYNIYLASKNIDGAVLAPGDVFSYNDAVGPRTASRGFKDAGVYVGNRVEQGIGGGICQVSSTLFNAAVLADLNIVYRTNHSMPVSYVPRGRDATVSYGSIDFKFSNNTDAPVQIRASAGNGTNTISIYGVKADKSKSIALEVVQTGTTPFTTKKKDAPDLPQGKVKIEQKGSNGTSYSTYKITNINGKQANRELLTKSSYVTIEQIEWVGTGPAGQAAPDPVVPNVPPPVPPLPEEVEAGGTPEPPAVPEPVAPAA